MEINYSINTPSVIKLNSFAKSFDYMSDLLVIGYLNLYSEQKMVKFIFITGLMKKNLSRII